MILAESKRDLDLHSNGGFTWSLECAINLAQKTRFPNENMRCSIKQQKLSLNLRVVTSGNFFTKDPSS